MPDPFWPILLSYLKYEDSEILLSYLKYEDCEILLSYLKYGDCEILFLILNMRRVKPISFVSIFGPWGKILFRPL